MNLNLNLKEIWTLIGVVCSTLPQRNILVIIGWQVLSDWTRSLTKGEKGWPRLIKGWRLLGIIICDISSYTWPWLSPSVRYIGHSCRLIRIDQPKKRLFILLSFSFLYSYYITFLHMHIAKALPAPAVGLGQVLSSHFLFLYYYYSLLAFRNLSIYTESCPRAFSTFSFSKMHYHEQL